MQHTWPSSAQCNILIIRFFSAAQHNLVKNSRSRHSRHKDSEILSRTRREPSPEVAAVKQYENNNKPRFLNCEALSKQAAVDEQQPKGETESILIRVKGVM